MIKSSTKNYFIGVFRGHRVRFDRTLIHLEQLSFIYLLEEIISKSIIEKWLPYWSEWSTVKSSLGAQPLDISIEIMENSAKHLEKMIQSMPYGDERTNLKISLLKQREKSLEMQIGSLLNYPNLSKEDVALIEASIGDKETNIMVKIEQVKQQETNLSDEIERMTHHKIRLENEIRWIQSKIDQGEEYPKDTLFPSEFIQNNDQFDPITMKLTNPKQWKQILVKHQMKLSELSQQIQKRQEKFGQLYFERRKYEIQLDGLFKNIKEKNGIIYEQFRSIDDKLLYKIHRTDLAEHRAKRLTYEIELLQSTIGFIQQKIYLSNDEEEKFKFRIKYGQLFPQLLSKRNDLNILLRESAEHAVPSPIPPHQIDHLIRLQELCSSESSFLPRPDNANKQSLKNSIIIDSIKYEILICCSNYDNDDDIIHRIKNALPKEYSFYMKGISSTEHIKILLNRITVAAIAIINDTYESNESCEVDITYIFKRQFTLVFLICNRQFKPSTNWLNIVWRAPSTQKVYLDSTDFEQDLRDATLNAQWNLVDNSLIPKRTNSISHSTSEHSLGDFHQWNIIPEDSTLFKHNYREHLADLSRIEDDTKLKSSYYNYVRLHSTNPEILELSKRSATENDMYYLIQAYTVPTKFSETLNHHLSANILFFFESSLKDSVNYQLVNALVDIVGLFIYRSELQLYSFSGTVFRGMNISEEEFGKHVVGSRRMNTSFLSASKQQEVAKIFLASERNGQSIGVFYTFVIHNINHRRTAIDISSISRFTEEQEVLILPFSAFRVMSITQSSDPSMSFEIGMEEIEAYSLEDINTT